MTYEDKFALAERTGQEGCFARIDETHPVGIFLGLESGNRAILVVCPKRPPECPAYAAIRVEARPRQHNEWALVLCLTRPDLKGLFTRLVEDLDTALRAQPTDPGQTVISRLARWQRLLSRGADDILDDHELRGLMAELDFLLGEGIPAVGKRTAATGWHGQYDAPKDFVFDSAEVEVKAVHRQHRHIVISSLEQLTNNGLPLYMWSRVVELGTAVQGDPHSVAAFVARVRAALADDAVAAEALEDSLRAGHYFDRPEYGLRAVHFGAATCYKVVDPFPRLQRDLVAPGILVCKYEISVTDLEPFRVGTWRGVETNGG